MYSIPPSCLVAVPHVARIDLYLRGRTGRGTARWGIATYCGPSLSLTSNQSPSSYNIHTKTGGHIKCQLLALTCLSSVLHNTTAYNIHTKTAGHIKCQLLALTCLSSVLHNTTVYNIHTKMGGHIKCQSLACDHVHIVYDNIHSPSL